MSEFFVSKPPMNGAACLKIVNDDGVELSVAFDDSCGCLPNLDRVSMVRFRGHGPQATSSLEDEAFHVTAEDFLTKLADHLGYNLTKKE